MKPDPTLAALLADALAEAADRRQRTAILGAKVVEADRLAGRDARPGALRVTRLLAEAGTLADTAGLLSRGELLLALPPAVHAAPGWEPTADYPTAELGSQQAAQPDVEAVTQRAEQAARKTDAQLSRKKARKLEDPDTGALPEDEPARGELAPALALGMAG